MAARVVHLNGKTLPPELTVDEERGILEARRSIAEGRGVAWEKVRTDLDRTIDRAARRNKRPGHRS